MKLAETRQQTGPARAGRGHAAAEVVVDGAPDRMAAVIEEALVLRRRAEAAVVEGCEAAVLAGLRLIWLHRETAQAPNGARVSRDTREGFDHAVAAIYLDRRTAYRWMTAAGRILVLDGEGETMPEVAAAVPDPGSAEWRRWEGLLVARARGMSLRRLALGHSTNRTDIHRLDELIDGAERGSEASEEALRKVEDGKLTLALAMRAAAGGEATREKTRRDPCYLDIDGTNGGIRGLVPRAMVTLGNAFARWDELPAAAREQCREAWKELVSHLPKELR